MSASVICFRHLLLSRSVNNASEGAGIILGTINGRVPDGAGGMHDAVGMIVWRYSFDEHAALVVSPATWFGFSDQRVSKIGLNDASWITLTDGLQALRYRLDWEWVWDPAVGPEGGFVAAFFLAEGGDLLGSSVQWARAGGINQAGDAAAYFRAVNSQAHTLVAKRLNGSGISFPKFTTKRDQVDTISEVQAINDVTAKHGVQVLGNVGWDNTRYGSYQNPRPALWEAGGSVRLLEDITAFPSDASYVFRPLLLSMYDLNDASWICWRDQSLIVRPKHHGPDGVDSQSVIGLVRPSAGRAGP